MAGTQAVILNLSFPKSAKELLDLIESRGKLDMQALLEVDGVEESIHSWTMPTWMKVGDIVFFMHSKNSKFTIARIKAQLKRDSSSYTNNQIKIINEALELGADLYDKYGGKIFMVGEIGEPPFNYDPSEFKYSPHFRGRIFAYVKQCVLFKNPIDLSEFKKFIKLSSGGSITPVCGNDFTELKHLIKSKNQIPGYLEESEVMLIPLNDIDDSNWLSIATQYRHSFRYEIQFRVYYVDRFLKLLSDQKKIYRECECRKNTANYPSYVDNVIKFGNRYFPVEVKINKDGENDLIGQLRKYCNLDRLYLESNQKSLVNNADVIRDKVLLIDTFAVYLYRNYNDSIEKILDLDGLVIEDIFLLRRKLFELLKIKGYFSNRSEKLKQ